MEIKNVHRPWQSKSNWKNRRVNTSYYNSSEWTRLRREFIASPSLFILPSINGLIYKNCYCYECWKRGIVNGDRIEVDHIVRREDGGKDEFPNLMSLCHSDHSKKSAREANESKKLNK